MIEFFSMLTNMLHQSWWIALVSSFIWGVLSVVLSPCHLATIPLIVGFINDRESITKARAAFFSSLFAFGILITLGVIGIITGLLGRIMGDIGGVGNYIVGGFLLFFGVYMIGVLKLPFLEKGVSPIVKKKGAFSAFILGLVFGIALGPCAFAFMAPMLGIVFNIAATNLFFAIFLILSFAVGHSIVIVLAGTFTKVVKKFLNWNQKSGGVLWIKRICGVLLIMAGIYLFITA